MVTEDKSVHYSNSTHKLILGTRVAKADTLAGDIYMYDIDNDTNFWMRPSIFTNDVGEEEFTDDKYQAIAVVAIPASHDVYGNGDVGMVSLNYMRYDTPETGGAVQSIRWGYNDADLSLTNYTKVPVYKKNATELSSEYNGYHASDMFTNLRFSGDGVDTTGGYSKTSYDCIPSPYTQDGIGRNELYYTPIMVDEANTNALSDFNGKGNTDVIIAAVTVSGWQTSTTIANSSDAGNYPAACCCRRYKRGPENGTAGAGKWYLPAAGEGGYLMARLSKINQALTKIKVFDTSCVLVSTIYYHWLSTEYSSSGVRYLSTDRGYHKNCTKKDNNYVRGWLRA